MKKTISLILTISILTLCTFSLLSCQPEIKFTKVETKGTVRITADCNRYGHTHSGDALYIYSDYALLVDYEDEEYYIIHKSAIQQVYWDIDSPNDANKEIEEAAINDFLSQEGLSYTNGYFIHYSESGSKKVYKVIHCSNYYIGE